MNFREIMNVIRAHESYFEQVFISTKSLRFSFVYKDGILQLDDIETEEWHDYEREVFRIEKMDKSEELLLKNCKSFILASFLTTSNYYHKSLFKDCLKIVNTQRQRTLDEFLF